MATTKPTTRKPAARKAPAKSRAAAQPRVRHRSAAALDTTSVLSIGAAILTVGAAVAGFLARRQIAAWAAPDTVGGSGEHQAPDLALDLPRPGADARAPQDFRPDIDAPMTPAEREALRPATGPAPSLVAEAGMLNSQTGAAN